MDRPGAEIALDLADSGALFCLCRDLLRLVIDLEEFYQLPEDPYDWPLQALRKRVTWARGLMNPSQLRARPGETVCRICGCDRHRAEAAKNLASGPPGALVLIRPSPEPPPPCDSATTKAARFLSSAE